MFSPAADIAGADTAVRGFLGVPPAQRFYSFGQADERTAKPYAVWQVISGAPENLLAGRPLADIHVVQVDVYADNPNNARNVAQALVRAFELQGYVTSWNGEFIDPDTKLRRISFTVEFITPR